MAPVSQPEIIGSTQPTTPRKLHTGSVKNLIPHFIQTQYLSKRKHGSFEAYAMFVDLSGFTRMTETLMNKGTEGAERLSNILNAIFEPMVRLVYAGGGEIPYFAGDAFTAVFPAARQTATGVIENAAGQLASLRQVSEQFEEVEIKAKIGLSFGQVEWGIVGTQNLAFYFRGDAVEGCSEAQKRAIENDI
ncbi:MAG: adenylate/guanylate cyclase domain-containing protein, partial [Bacteroidetes bacterium]